LPGKTGQKQPYLFATDNDRHQRLSLLIYRINDRYGRCSIGFGTFRAMSALSRSIPRSPRAGKMGILTPR
jgi:hypothetical protein